MATYKAPVDDVMFLLNDVFHVERYNNLPGFADATPDLLEAVLGEAAKFCEDVLTPLNRVGDKEGCHRREDGSVTTPTGFKDAYKRLTEGGWIGASAPEDFGGQGLPMALTQSIGECILASLRERPPRSPFTGRPSRKHSTFRNSSAVNGPAR
jgi:acyl-CoA dehydrogenase